MIVHDLRSPLTAISTSLKLLNEMAPPDDDPLGRSIRKTTEVSLRALRKLLHLVDSLLDIAKMESGNMTLETSRHELKPIADNVRFELSPLAEELNIRVDVLIPDNIPPLMIDSNKVERVLLNLVDNALKFTPVDGLVEIRAECDDNKLVRIRVTDTGPGIPDEHKARIFDRFQQVEQGKSHRRGTGLGLTFCRLTIEAHGGSIWIEDNVAGGSVFAFTLPMAVS
jgi:signal transduction histidine kinase